MSRPEASIRDLFHVPERFIRSVQLERDFHDPHALAGYIVTPAMAAAFQRLADALRPTSGRRAWRITGDYGVGKSSFALVLAHLLANPQSPRVAAIAAEIDWSSTRKLWPLLVTGSREDLIANIGRGIAESLAWNAAIRRKDLSRLREAALAIAGGTGGLAELEALVQAVQEAAAKEDAGVLLVIDEMGKLLEHAALSPETSDVFALQRLSELAARSGERPLLLLGLLHQGFLAYAERLPTTSRHEWDKVAGRFDEIVFNQPLAHTAALVAGALGVHATSLPKPILNAARETAKATARMGWLSGAVSDAKTLDAAPLYPLHPTLLPPLVRFFARYGQHERSLFGFLLSDEPFGLREFADRAPGPASWYGLPEFYDYVRSTFGHRLAGRSHDSHWLRIAATIETAEDLTDPELRVLKAVGLLNLLDAEDLLPTDRALVACMTPQPSRTTEAAIQTLMDRGTLFARADRGGYRLWPNSSVNLRAVLEQAVVSLPHLEGVAGHLQPHLDATPLLARRHYIAHGTLRYFEVRHAVAGALAQALAKPSAADGLVIIALADTREERELAIATVTASPFADRADVIVGVGQPLAALSPELLDLKRWEWVQTHTPELAHDAFAAAEVGRMLAYARRMLVEKLANRSGVYARGETMLWVRAGASISAPQGLVRALSDICDDLFPNAPRIFNELLNRNVLSSAAAAARMRLIEGIFDASDREALGLDPKKAPPERSMYLSVLKRGGLHVETSQGWRMLEPPVEHELRLRPAFDAILKTIDSGHGDPVGVPVILSELKSMGVRDGVAPLLFALVLKLRAHELALYEEGTFVARWGAGEFMRLVKQPNLFAIQPCRIAGVRAEVFARLAEVFARAEVGRDAQLLDVVTALCQFAASLPEYVRRAGALGPTTAAVRDVLLSAREPATLVFRDLPTACGLAPFLDDEAPEPSRSIEFVRRLQDAVEELRSSYPRLVQRLTNHIAGALTLPGFDRAVIASRAARVALAAREPRLRTFAMRLRDPQLSDESWIEALAAYVLARPPKRWGSGDERRFMADVGDLAEIFHRVEGAAFDGDATRPAQDALRLSLTRGDGADHLHVLHPAELDAPTRKALEAIEGLLPQDAALRLQFLSQLLWSELEQKAVKVPAARDASVERNEKEMR